MTKYGMTKVLQSVNFAALFVKITNVFCFNLEILILYEFT
jgi:hypothetical protein